MRGIKVPPKYRGPSGETWAGRGARPVWLVAAIRGGKKLEKSARKGRKKRRGGAARSVDASWRTPKPLTQIWMFHCGQ